MPDNDLVAALEAAVAAAPDDRVVRLHLVRLLTGTDPARALHHATALLAVVPDDAEALGLAADACAALGDERRAAAYRGLAAASAPPAEPAPLPAAPVRGTTVGFDWIAAEEQVADVEVELPPGGDLPAAELPTVRLADVGGMDAVKHRLEAAFLAPLRNEDLRKMYAKSLRGGLLLWGPPGCGKTFLARALAGELGARFVTIGLPDVLTMWFGESEQRLHALFEEARRGAPCVVFLDEIDALGQKRSHVSHSPMRGVVNQLLAELDGSVSSNDGVFVLAATNHPWDVDPALKRPGRLDRAVLVLPPDRAARVAILTYHLRERPVGNDVDLGWIADRTDGFSGADLAHLCEVAAEEALVASATSGTPRPIRMGDLKAAVKHASPSVRAWIETARNYATFADEGGSYDELLEYLRARRLA